MRLGVGMGIGQQMQLQAMQAMQLQAAQMQQAQQGNTQQINVQYMQQQPQGVGVQNTQQFANNQGQLTPQQQQQQTLLELSHQSIESIATPTPSSGQWHYESTE